jgi:hypothetical protein
MLNIKKNRPEGFPSKETPALKNIAQKIYYVIKEVQKTFVYKTLILPKTELEELSTIIVEFAEDIHNDIGIWKAIEHYNQKFFGNPLPFSLPKGESFKKNSINTYRVHHLLWKVYQELIPGLILSPEQIDLEILATQLTYFLKQIENEFPKHSTISQFFKQPNRYGWEVKRKLIWLGQNSYIFRRCFNEHIKDFDKDKRIQGTDDFICQHKTKWSGLGVVDILAEVINISDKQRKELRSWNERHAAYYKIISKKYGKEKVENIINNKMYNVYLDTELDVFNPGEIILGNLVPWNKEWYWSGVQYRYSHIPDKDLKEMRMSFIKDLGKIVYRYHDELAERAYKSIKTHHQNFIDFHGDDLVVFPDGYAMAAALQNQSKQEFKAAPKKTVEKIMKKSKLKNPCSNFSFPTDLLENENGVGVFFNPEEGLEVFPDFYTLQNGLQKKGENVTENEKDIIFDFIESDAISLSFVNRLIKKYGFKSITEAFLIINNPDKEQFDYLLRCYKGQYYVKRYPNLSLDMT